jgi:hypothetical protein
MVAKIEQEIQAELIKRLRFNVSYVAEQVGLINCRLTWSR